MASTAISAQGSTLMISSTSEGEASTPIGNMISFSGFDGEASEIDYTNLSSTAKESGLGLIDYGAFNVEWHIDYDDAGQTAARSAASSSEKRRFKLTLPNGKVRGFDGLVKNANSLNGAVDAALTGTLSVKITGPVVDETPAP